MWAFSHSVSIVSLHAPSRTNTALVIELRADRLEPDLPAELKSTCFRITQEAITNVVRHAGAKQVSGRVAISAERNWSWSSAMMAPALRWRRRNGGAARGASLGLLGMQERVALIDGRLRIKSARGGGTEIRGALSTACARAPVNPKESVEKAGRDVK